MTGQSQSPVSLETQSNDITLTHDEISCGIAECLMHHISNLRNTGRAGTSPDTPMQAVVSMSSVFK
jgi:hypothetical protein